MERFAENDIQKEIQLKELFKVVKRRFWIVIIVMLLFTSLGVLYVAQPRVPLYEASTRIYLQADTDLFNTLRVILREPVVLEGVVRELKLNRSEAQLRGQIYVGMVDNSTILNIRVVDTDQAMAAQIANAVVESYKQVTRDTIFFTNIIVLTPAEVDHSPYPINVTSNRAIYAGFIIGLIAGIGLIFLLDAMDDRLRSDREIEQLLGIAVLGGMSKVRRKDRARKTNKKKSLLLRGEAVGP